MWTSWSVAGVARCWLTLAPEAMPTATDQDVHIQAIGTIGTVNVAGQNSSLNFGGSGTGNVGGFFDGVFYDNHARAYIDDLAVVSALRDITVNAQTRNELFTAV